MIKILYIVSTLKRSGPTIQLLNIIRFLDKKKYDISVLTLSPEPKESCINEYRKIGIHCDSINLSRINGIFFALPKLIKYIKRIKPDIIHSQGLRPDILAGFCVNFCKKWFLTLHNYAYEDYSNRYGLIGILFAKIHWYYACKCNNCISCSKALSERLEKIGIKSIGISNGIEVEKFKPKTEIYNIFDKTRPFFIVSGHLSKIKNNSMVVKFFNKYFENNKGTLVFIGDGEEKNYLKSLTNKENILFLGRVPNPEFYLKQADIIISASITEGLPNSILEGLCCGLPAVLSDIPSHEEIKEKMTKDVFVYDLTNEKDFFDKIKLAIDYLKKTSKKKISERLIENFSAEKMSQKYQKIYTGSLQNA